ncbi:MAG: lamin tail domain-containing protein [Proteobacteria bacterium]|nr:lamin tail domain-containing protein [Pseudomonadota bacterium]MBU1647807.1 lamin tail domain-containing protein [Pseudomonadota bacterium]
MKSLLSLVLLFLCCCTSDEANKDSPPTNVSRETDPFPSQLLETSGLYESGLNPKMEASRIRFMARDGHILTAYTYRATGFSVSDGPIVFIIHGAARNAIDYLRRFMPIAERHGALAIAPEFPASIYGPGSDRFTLAVGKERPPYTDTYRARKWRTRDDYLYSEIEHLFEAIRREVHSGESTYRIWGHSAGGQFVHRLMTFRSDARVASAVAVNAGFYTLPAYGNGSDPNYFMPYGLQGTPLNAYDVKRLLQAPLVVLVGELDTETGKESSSVRDSSYADFQGSNRRQRAEFYYRTGKQEAHRLGLNFGWRFAVVPGAGHNSRKVGPSAAWFLFNRPDAIPCVSTLTKDAKGLVINEIYGDPASGRAGDANNDGFRDAQEDEFVELVNTSDHDICLSGWYLGDASDPSRHRFPVGSLLPAGKALVVFGGGVPTGQFGGAEVQTAVSAGELNLNNEGDVLSLSDSHGNTHQRVSWGDCGGKQCAKEHIPHAININQSLNRWPEANGPFSPHSNILDGASYSPGSKVNGTPFD